MPALRSERYRLVQDALDRLSAREREQYVRRIFEVASIDDLATSLGMSREAILKARQRARQRLAAILAPQLVDDLEPPPARPTPETDASAQPVSDPAT